MVWIFITILSIIYLVIRVSTMDTTQRIEKSHFDQWTDNIILFIKKRLPW
jgi:hypothetical protein